MVVIPNVKKWSGNKCGHMIESDVMHNSALERTTANRPGPSSPGRGPNPPANRECCIGLRRRRSRGFARKDSPSRSRPRRLLSGCNGRDIRNRAFRARVTLVLRREQDRNPGLRKTAPAIFQQIGLEEHANPALQLEMVFDDKRIAGSICRVYLVRLLSRVMGLNR